MSSAAENKKPPLLEAKRLCLAYGGQERLAVDHVSFRIEQGGTLGLVGASGAGKSSIARMIMQISRPSAGDILFKGKSIFAGDGDPRLQSRRNIQFVFQEPSASLSPRRTVGDSLLEPLVHFGIGDRASRQEKIRQTLETVGLEAGVLNRYPRQFSVGQQQRIAIARALVTDPQLVVADEPVSSLDVSVQAQILKLLQSLQRELGITLLFISHDLAVIRQIASEVAIMYHGQLLEQCAADVFFDGPAHPYSKTLLSFASGEYQGGEAAISRTRAVVKPEACVYAGHCPAFFDRCGSDQPKTWTLKDKSPSHRVKCHHYDASTNNE
jgi:ABC-type glutathione transport system ATPase component